METKDTLAELVEELRKAVIAAEVDRGRERRNRPKPSAPRAR